ncbi:Homeodomain-like DNA binding domain-containing transcription factor [Phycomyces blakesleeanus]|uniref:Homeodomain-like DNA binding domain-containing transcription factor n=2 Tax=Phycomyces blakesleeanus TaxID=4837 RepID=A0A167KQ89_PHYB8|nr:Homeodomain-like DNA binding domain-containing transcription factor [Phycomyces blakesleeanus NRRL 1555(-)]OAD68627.1 Homeodomain-like DNA binding domain-containing transcription factor [Phycomyces blakesleeanus NRRL 1555(-)]|eukprot:XP_018286667.1 Homeodomain-like DNA binding domain-containing transcription factor [Phycomyces blakesleeanus NRRL 1555(-)]
MSHLYKNLTLDSSDSDEDSVYESAVEDVLDNVNSNVQLKKRSEKNEKPKAKARRGRPFRVGMSNRERIQPSIPKPITRVEPLEESEPLKFSFFSEKTGGTILSASDVGFSDSEESYDYPTNSSTTKPDKHKSIIFNIKQEQKEEHKQEKDEEYELEESDNDVEKSIKNKPLSSESKRRRSTTPTGNLMYLDAQDPKKRIREDNQLPIPVPYNPEISENTSNDSSKLSTKLLSQTSIGESSDSNITSNHPTSSNLSSNSRSLPASFLSGAKKTIKVPSKHSFYSDDEDVELKEIDLFPMRSTPSDACKVLSRRSMDSSGYRAFWTPEEEIALEEGLKIHGAGNWVEIKAEFPEALLNRNPTQLKDKVRTEHLKRKRLGLPLGIYKATGRKKQ